VREGHLAGCGSGRRRWCAGAIRRDGEGKGGRWWSWRNKPDGSIWSFSPLHAGLFAPLGAAPLGGSGYVPYLPACLPVQCKGRTVVRFFRGGAARAESRGLPEHAQQRPCGWRWWWPWRVGAASATAAALLVPCPTIWQWFVTRIQEPPGPPRSKDREPTILPDTWAKLMNWNYLLRG